MTRPLRDGPQWWVELETLANEQADRHTAAWWEVMRDEYLARFPNADETSVENMHSFVAWARQREQGGN